MRSVYREIERNPTRRDRVELGLVFAVGMSVFGALARFRWDSPGVATSLWIAAGVGLVLSLVPPIGRVLYVLWMGLGLTIGLVTSPILMFAVYAAVIVPVGLFLKLTRRDIGPGQSRERRRVIPVLRQHCRV